MEPSHFFCISWKILSPLSVAVSYTHLDVYKRQDRVDALDKLVKLQKGDFMEIFKVMSGLPVIVRLLDPPLNEFLPKEHEVTKKLDLLRAEGKGESDEAKKLELLLKLSLIHI